MAKKKPQDTTLRNIRAARKREAKLEKRIERIEKMLQLLKTVWRKL